MAKEVLVTQEELDELNRRLEELINVKRPEAAERIKQAREYGDLSENAEYDAAKNEQGMVELEIRELQEKVENAKIIEQSVRSNKVALGSHVILLDIDMNETLDYRIVGSTGANIDEGKISNECPLALAIMGRKKGETVTVVTPSCSYDVKIVDILK